MKDCIIGKKATIIHAAVIITLVWVLLRFALRWFLPFVAAFFLAWLIEPVVRFVCQRLKLPRGVASAACTVLLFAAVIALTAIAAARLLTLLSTVAQRMSGGYGGLSETAALLYSKLRGLIEAAPPELQAPLRETLLELPARAAELVASLSKRIISGLSEILSAAPKILLFAFTCALGTFFISGTYSQVTGFMARRVPSRYRSPLHDIRTDLGCFFGKWLKAQLILSAVTFCELMVLFCVLRVNFAVVLALVIAVADLLPAVGTGIVLLPWALWCLLAGHMPRAVLLFLGFVVILLVKNILEPKLLSAGFGVPPLVTLIAMYVGFSALGVFGMVIFPIILVLVKRLYERGYIRFLR